MFKVRFVITRPSSNPAFEKDMTIFKSKSFANKDSAELFALMAGANYHALGDTHVKAEVLEVL